MCTPASPAQAGRCCTAVPAANTPSARTVDPCRARSATAKLTLAWVSRCAPTATTTRVPWCGMPTRPNCGGAPPSPCAAAWISSPAIAAPASSVSYAKVAEFQGRGLVHFHAIIRLDGLDPADPTRITAPPPGFTAQLLTAAIRARGHLDLVRHRAAPGPAARVGHLLGSATGHPDSADVRRRGDHRHRRRLATWPSTPPNPPKQSARSPSGSRPATCTLTRARSPTTAA